MQIRIDTLVDLALQEDAGMGDITSQSIFSHDHHSQASILAREDLTVCGLEVAKRVFQRVDPTVSLDFKSSDGERLKAGTPILLAEGATISILTAERTALNFLQRLSGIATLSHRFAKAVAQTGSGVRIVDTRKTIPGWRALEKYAVRCGGCYNHRASLGEHILIKENHIRAAGSIAEAVQRCRSLAPHCAKIEVEVESMDEVQQALNAGAEIIMLDNMSPMQAKQAVGLINGAAMVEVSGGIDLANLADYAMAGIDVISVGALTHSAPAVDMSMIITARDNI